MSNSDTDTHWVSDAKLRDFVYTELFLIGCF